MIRISAIALLAALGFASFNLRAEDAPAGGAPKRPHKEGGEAGKEGRGGAVRERVQAALFEGITLTDDQKAALEKLKEEGRKAAEAAHKDGEAPKEPTREERKAMMDKRTAAIRAILTEDQAKIFDENVKKAEAKRAEMMKKVREGKGKGEGKGKPEGDAK